MLTGHPSLKDPGVRPLELKEVFTQFQTQYSRSYSSPEGIMGTLCPTPPLSFHLFIVSLQRGPVMVLGSNLGSLWAGLFHNHAFPNFFHFILVYRDLSIDERESRGREEGRARGSRTALWYMRCQAPTLGLMTASPALCS